jgi:hypothetical protein
VADIGTSSLTLYPHVSRVSSVPAMPIYALCHTAGAAFHETFWVVTGTAAPVIALGWVVSMNEILDEFLRVALLPDSLRTLEREGPRKLAAAVWDRYAWLAGAVRMIAVGSVIVQAAAVCPGFSRLNSSIRCPPGCRWSPKRTDC